MGRVGGIISLKVDGTVYNAAGSFTWSLGKPTREGIAGMDRVHGYTEKPTVPFIEGTITDNDGLDLDLLADWKDATVTLDLPTGKTITLYKAWFTNKDGLSGTTENGEISVRFEGMTAEAT